MAFFIVAVFFGTYFIFIIRVVWIINDRTEKLYTFSVLIKYAFNLKHKMK